MDQENGRRQHHHPHRRQAHYHFNNYIIIIQWYSNGNVKVKVIYKSIPSTDKRLKTKILPIENPLDKLSKINGYNFEWIENKEVHLNKGKDIGVIAQEINEILPEITTTRDNGFMCVCYKKITAFLVSCVKKQQKIIEEQKR